MAKTILFLGAPKETVEGMRQARRAGYRIFAADANPAAPGAEEAEEFFQASIYHVDDVLRVIPPDPRSQEIDGVVMVGVDAPLVWASLTDALGLPGQSIRTAGLASHKLEMKKALRAGGVSVPDFWPLPSFESLAERMEVEPTVYVIKPPDSRGARGVLKIDPGSDLRWAYDFSRSQSPSGEVMLERWLSGEQYSTESLLWRGEHHLAGTAHREYASTRHYEPFLVENGGESPADLSEAQLERIDEILSRSAAALGLTDGPLKGDLVWHDGEPHVIEVATRLSGGYFCTHHIPVSFGAPLVPWACDIAVDKEPDWGAAEPPEPAVYTVNRKLFLDEPGRVAQVRLRDEMLPEKPWVVAYRCYVDSGSIRDGVRNHTDDAAHAMAAGGSCAEASARAQQLIDNIEVTLE